MLHTKKQHPASWSNSSSPTFCLLLQHTPLPSGHIWRWCLSTCEYSKETCLPSRLSACACPATAAAQSDRGHGPTSRTHPCTDQAETGKRAERRVFLQLKQMACEYEAAHTHTPGVAPAGEASEEVTSWVWRRPPDVMLPLQKELHLELSQLGLRLGNGEQTGKQILRR